MLSLSDVVNPKAGWYRGDFHAHTNCSSDGHYPPHGLVGLARAEGLDFLAITDHNAVEAFTYFETQPDILVIPSIEVTLDVGHFNVFGLQAQTPWLNQICADSDVRVLNGPFATPTALMQQACAENLLVSINHPRRDACRWIDETTDLRAIHCLEIWNKPSFPKNAQPNCEAMLLWTKLLNAGYRITAIGGSDYHLPIPKPEDIKPPERLGQPSTYVFAHELSGAAILHGLRQQQVYVSMGAQVEFQADVAGQSYGIGSDIGLTAADIHLSGKVIVTPTEGYARLIKNGDVIVEQATFPDRQTPLSLTDSAEADQPIWYRFEVIDPHGQMLAVTNPIFAGPRPLPELHYYGDFV